MDMVPPFTKEKLKWYFTWRNSQCIMIWLPKRGLTLIIKKYICILQMERGFYGWDGSSCWS